jgi:peptide/nickel transport system permease protein
MTNEAFTPELLEAGSFRELMVRRLSAVMKAAWRNPLGFFFGVVSVGLILAAIFGPTLAPYPADATNAPLLEAPSNAHPFGTDDLFRDIFSRILVGAQVTLGISLFSVLLATAFSIVFGLPSGYLGGKVDLAISRVLDVMLAFPALVFAIFFLTIFQPTFFTVALAIGLVMMPAAARIVRGAVIAIRGQAFIEAAVSIGASPTRIMFRHILPSVVPTIIITASIQIGIAVLLESGISFLGLGVSDAAHPSWGRMLQEMRPVWQEAWWTVVVPIAAISITVLSFNIFGDALRDWLDPRLRNR